MNEKNNIKPKDIVKKSKYIEHQDIPNFENLDLYTKEKFDTEDSYEEAGYGNKYFSSSELMPSFKTSEKYDLIDESDFDINPNQKPKSKPTKKSLEKDFDDLNYPDFPNQSNFSQVPFKQSLPQVQNNFEYFDVQNENSWNSHQQTNYPQATNSNYHNSQNNLVTNYPALPSSIEFTRQFNMPMVQQNNVPTIYETSMYDFNQFAPAPQYHQMIDVTQPINVAYNRQLMLPAYLPRQFPSQQQNFVNQQQMSTQLMSTQSNFLPSYPQYQMPQQNLNQTSNFYNVANLQNQTHTMPTPIIANNVDHTHLVDITGLKSFEPMTQTFKPAYQQEYDRNFVNTNYWQNIDEDNLSPRSKIRMDNLRYLHEKNLIDSKQYYKARHKIIENDKNEAFKTAELQLPTFKRNK